MGQSISKIGILVGMDTSGLATGASQGAATLRGFKTQVDAIDGGGVGSEFKLTSAFKAAGAGLHAMEGSLKGIGSSMALLAGGGFVMVGIAAEIAALFAAAKFSAWGIKLAMGQDAEFTGKWKVFKDELADLALKVGELFMPLIKWWLDVGIAATRALKGGTRAEAGSYDRLTDPEGYARKVKDANDKIIASGQEWSDKYTQQVKAIEDAAKRKADAMASAAEQISRSLRTPAEVFNDTVAELNQLMNANLLTFTTFSRGINKAASDFAELNNKAEKLKSIQARTMNVAALERGSSAELSARNKVETLMAGSADIAKQQLEVQKRQEATEKQIRDILKANAVSIQPVNIR